MDRRHFSFFLAIAALIAQISSLGTLAAIATQVPVQSAQSSEFNELLKNIQSEFAQSGDREEFVGKLQGLSLKFATSPQSQIRILDVVAELNKNPKNVGVFPGTSDLGKLAIVSSSRLLLIADANGQGNPELSCQAANLIDVLGNQFRTSEQPVASDLFLKVGSIGRKLAQNPAFPAAARAGLAAYLISEARGEIMRCEEVRALAAVNEALTWGLVEFDKVLLDETIKDSPNFDQIKTAVESRRTQYRQSIQPTISSAVNNFQSFPFNFSLLNVEQARIAKSHYDDSEIMVVDIWGTWCAPCRASIPHLNNLQESYRDKGLKVVGIAMEQAETLEQRRESLRSFLEANEVNYDCLLGEPSVTQQIPNFKSYPT
ncbi:MAG: TlpA disulfide reductase family protein, partial [Pirellulaceae bacterium]